MKICTKCQANKNFNEFYFVKHSGYYRNECKSCWKQRTAKYKFSPLALIKIKERNRKWNKENREIVNRRLRKYYKINKELNPKIKLLKNLRRRILHSVINGRKSATTLKLLGCSVEFVKSHIESQFKNGMSWDNYGIRGWHIDHIRPCASFDLTIPEQQFKCFHYTNLQPLWATTEIARKNGDFVSIGNIEKGSKLGFS